MADLFQPQPDAQLLPPYLRPLEYHLNGMSAYWRSPERNRLAIQRSDRLAGLAAALRRVWQSGFLCSAQASPAGCSQPLPKRMQSLPRLRQIPASRFCWGWPSAYGVRILPVECVPGSLPPKWSLSAWALPMQRAQQESRFESRRGKAFSEGPAPLLVGALFAAKAAPCCR